MKYKSKSREVIPAILTAVSLLLVAGGVAWAIRAHAPPEPEGEPKRLRFPTAIGDWTGREIPVEAAIARAADVDFYVSNQYARPGETVRLWIAQGVRGRDLAPHRPDVCYPLNGWTLKGRETVRVALGDGTAFEATLFRFSRGPMEVDKARVLHYYVIDGRFYPHLGFWLRPRLALAGGIRSMTSVQVLCSESEVLGPDAAIRAVCAFAADAAPVIAAVQDSPAPLEEADAAGGSDGAGARIAPAGESSADARQEQRSRPR